MRVTPHFSVDEFDCHDGTSYPEAWINSRLGPLCRLLEEIRIACGGRAISILSGYRSPEWNAKVGGAKLSQHAEGRAADIRIHGMDPSNAHAIVLELVHEGRAKDLGGLGVYKRWIHVDVRPRLLGRIARWTGVGVGSEVA